MIEVKNVSHRLGGKTVLEKVNLTVEEGSIVGLVGNNGAGKSTLLRLISGVYQPDEGQIFSDGRLTSKEEGRRNLFFLPDDPYYTLRSTGKSLLELYKTFYPELDKETYGRLLGTWELPDNKPIRTFSKGMRRRLFIAIAIATGPKYLLLDEAFDGLDPLARLTVKSELNRLADENGTGVLISSHSLRELEDFCDSYALIDRKTVTHSGDLSQDLGQYCKFQLAYTLPVEKSWFEGLPTAYVELNGKFVKVILKGKSVAMEEALRRTQPAVLEEMPMDFEEMFIHQVEDRGYLNK